MVEVIIIFGICFFFFACIYTPVSYTQYENIDPQELVLIKTKMSNLISQGNSIKYYEASELRGNDGEVLYKTMPYLTVRESGFFINIHSNKPSHSPSFQLYQYSHNDTEVSIADTSFFNIIKERYDKIETLKETKQEQDIKNKYNLALNKIKKL